jgi:uncharacterized surface protein with fasciclin (FAS1) repeats
MRKASLFVVAVLMLVLSSVAVRAQDVVGALQANPELSTLLAAVQNADSSVLDALTSGTPLTVLAPNNEAFRNLSTFLNVSAEDLLENEPVLTALLQYHVLVGTFTSADLSNRVGEVLPTALENAFVSVTRKDDGTLSFNDVGEVVQADIQVGSLTIHIIDDVLLNRVINDTIAEFPFGVDPRDSGTGMVEMAYVRAAHLVADAPAVAVYANGELTFEGLEPLTVSDFVPVAPGEYDFVISPDTIENELAGVSDLALTAGTYYTIAALPTTGAVIASVVEQTAPEEGSTSVAVLHGVPGGPNVDVVVDGAAVVENLAFSESAVVTISDMSIAPVVVETGTETVLAELPEISTEDGDLVFVGVAITADGIAEVRAVTDVMDMMDMSGSNQTLFQIINSREDLSILRDALDASGGTELIDILSDNSVSLTVFAPNNDAFINLAAGLNIEPAALLADPALVTQILQYHLASPAYMAVDLVGFNDTSIFSELGEEGIYILASDGTVTLNRLVTVIEADVAASNGVVHVIDNVLLPAVALEALGLQ